MESVVTKGRHIPPILNAIGVACSVLGNHDLDHGVEELEDRMAECQFPWLVSNARHRDSGEPLAGAEVKLIIDHGGWKIGLLGLIEWEWILTLRTLEPDDIDFEDFVAAGDRLAEELIADGADLVVALTHMRQPNDERLAKEQSGKIDIVLGGHDHSYGIQQTTPHGTFVVKSGTDFRDFTWFTVDLPSKQFHSFVRERITGECDKDSLVSSITERYVSIVGDTMDEILGYTGVDLDARFSSIRTGETNLGNFICDVLRFLETPADVCLLNSGTFRADRIISKGPIRVLDLMQLFPMIDETVEVELTGEKLLQALENGVSQYPRLEGRFPQVSGVKFTFNPRKPPGNRIGADKVLVGGEPLDLERNYRLLTKEYLHAGKDGYDCLESCKVLVPAENLPCIQSQIRNHFKRLSVLNKLHNLTERQEGLVRKALVRMRTSSHVKESGDLTCMMEEHHEFCVHPVLEGRIRLEDAD